MSRRPHQYREGPGSKSKPKLPLDGLQCLFAARAMAEGIIEDLGGVEDASIRHDLKMLEELVRAGVDLVRPLVMETAPRGPIKPRMQNEDIEIISERIITLSRAGMSQRAIRRRLGVSPQFISQVLESIQ